MIVVWLKSVHIAALVVWCAGLLVLPLLYAQREAAGSGPSLHRLHAFTRFAYVVVISPAAFLAIGSGTALVLAREVFTVWFALKLLTVGALVGLHVRAGFVVLEVFNPGGHYGLVRSAVAVSVTAGVVGTILWLVLAKPLVPLDWLPEVLSEPGGLRPLVEDFSRRWIP